MKTINNSPEMKNGKQRRQIDCQGVPLTSSNISAWRIRQTEEKWFYIYRMQEIRINCIL